MSWASQYLVPHGADGARHAEVAAGRQVLQGAAAGVPQQGIAPEGACRTPRAGRKRVAGRDHVLQRRQLGQRAHQLLQGWAGWAAKATNAAEISVAGRRGGEADWAEVRVLIAQQGSHLLPAWPRHGAGQRRGDQLDEPHGPYGTACAYMRHQVQ